jgi:hypothetical protein
MSAGPRGSGLDARSAVVRGTSLRAESSTQRPREAPIERSEVVR